MDYDTFKNIFPSESFLLKCGITESEYKKQFIHLFETKGFTAVGLSEVSLSELYESGAVIKKRGGLCFIPEKLDISKRFRQEMAESVYGIFDIVVSLIRRMQTKLQSIETITMKPDGSISFGKERISPDEVMEITGIPPDTLTSLMTDMRLVLKDEPLVWSHVGTFTVKESTIVCEPCPQSSIERHASRGRPPHSIMPRLDDSGVPYVKAKRIEKPKARH